MEEICRILAITVLCRCMALWAAFSNRLHTQKLAQLARKVRRTASHRSVQNGSILYASEARNVAALRVRGELAKAEALVDKAVKAEAKDQGKGFLDIIQFGCCCLDTSTPSYG